MRRFRVKPYKRFVHNHQFGLVRHCRNDRQFLFHTMGIGRNRLRQCHGQFERVTVFTYARATRVRVNFINITDKIQILNPRHKSV